MASSAFRLLKIYTFVAFVCWPLSRNINLWERRLAQR
jgi:hypothetical protein